MNRLFSHVSCECGRSNLYPRIVLAPILKRNKINMTISWQIRSPCILCEFHLLFECATRQFLGGKPPYYIPLCYRYRHSLKQVDHLPTNETRKVNVSKSLNIFMIVHVRNPLSLLENDLFVLLCLSHTPTR